MTSDTLYFVFDVESIGLHGEGFAAGIVVVNGAGDRLKEALIACPPEVAAGSDMDRIWVKYHVPPLEVTHPNPKALRDMFWAEWNRWRKLGASMVADCCWPVEARFLAACVDGCSPMCTWEGPYPLIDLASVFFANGIDPTRNWPRRDDELPAHNPLHDARQSARLFLNELAVRAVSARLYGPTC